MPLFVDVRDLMKSGSQLAEEREQPIRIAVFVEPDAPVAVLDVLEERLRHATRTAQLQLVLLEPGVVPSTDPLVDAVIVLVGSGGAAAQEALRAPLRQGVPVALLSTSPLGETVARRAGVPSGDTLVEEDPDRLVDERLGDWLVDRLSRKRLALAHNFAFMRRQVAEEAVKATSWQNALIGGVTIIPGADMPLLTANQAKMLLQIAAAYGQKLGADRIKELAAVVGGAYVLRAVARQGLTLLPGFGWALKGGVAYGGTMAMGRAAIEYFEQGADLSQVTERLRHLRDSAEARARSIAASRRGGAALPQQPAALPAGLDDPAVAPTVTDAPSATSEDTPVG